MDTELHRLYAAAIHEDAQLPPGERVGIINAVLTVRDLHIEQLIARLGQYADRAIKNGERRELLEETLKEILDVFVPVTDGTEDGTGYVPLVHPWDVERWQNTLNATKETTT